MGLKRIFATQDNTISNAFKENLVYRATGSNMGAADILEVFSIYGQQTTSSIEKSRAMVQFDLTELSSVPAGASYYLKMFNCPHGETNPFHFNLDVQPISSSWSEGVGLDMHSYSDSGYSNWISRSSSAGWNTQGGDILNVSASQYFDTGVEDLEVDVTSIVNSWLSSSYANNGFIIKLPDALETSTETSYYTKRFFSRSSEYYVKRPVLEARWTDTIFDDRAQIFRSSSLLSTENTYNIYLYNIWNSQYKNIPSIGTGAIFVSLYGTLGGTELAGFTGSYVSTGTYKTQIYINSTSSTIYDVWKDGSGNELYTGSFTLNQYSAQNQSNKLSDKIVAVQNLKSFYKQTETARFRTFIRDKNWQPNIYTVATSEIQNQTLSNLYFYSYRVQDEFEIIPVQTSSLYNYTKMQYDISGNYTDINMSLYEPGYMYVIGFYTKDADGYITRLREEFKFRVEE